VWNEKGIELKITISPPFYKTKWFYSLSAILFFSLIYTFIKRREIQLKKEKKNSLTKTSQLQDCFQEVVRVSYRK
jgi:hypothetical protein